MISRNFLLPLALILLGSAALAQNGKIQIKIDLTHVVDDKVKVEVQAEKFSTDEVIYHMPKMIPGTYSIEDYGRFLSEFRALDKKGRSLPVERLTTNSWKISKAKKLKKITYWVEDSYDTALEGPEIFQPAGTNIEADVNFVINPSGFIGFFDGLTSSGYEINIIKPEGFYGSTGLIPMSVNNDLSTNLTLEGVDYSSGTSVDVFQTGNYDELVDSPIMYSLPDTTVIDVAGTQVLVSAYSPNKIASAGAIASTIEEVLMAQKDYLGGELPVEKYAFIFYFTDQPIMSYGALEHSYSSFYFMPEYSVEQMREELRGIAAHEFFHIVTPLNIHSEEIVPFNFVNPEMSRHLWLYEGITEYFADNAQVHGGLITIDQYINILREKMILASQYNDSLAFTDLSLGALDIHADEYGNVYEKGALIGLALDLTLLELSQGEYGVQEMMADLSKQFGKNQSFIDEELFDIITAMTYPEVRQFFATYVEGEQPLNYPEIFKKAGLVYEPYGLFFDYSFGLTQSNLGVDMEEGFLFVQNVEELDEFGKAIGYQEGDVLLGFNNTEMPPLGPETMTYLQGIMQSMEEGKEFTVKVGRSNGEELVEQILSAETRKIERAVPHTIRPDENATAEQVKVRLAWLGLD
jgi:predicted metalloprotease with PDZ domain